MRRENRPRRVSSLVTAVLAATWLLSGVAVAQEDASGSISASDQSGDGSAVLIDEVTIEGGGGFVVVHLDDEGAPGEVLGNAEIPEGTSTDVTVTLDSPVEDDVTLWPMLHFDAGEMGTYEFPGADGPVVVDGEVVVVPIEYTIELPFTGGPSPWLAAVAVALVLGGLLMVRQLSVGDR
jgi:hypothetical protein